MLNFAIIEHSFPPKINGENVRTINFQIAYWIHFPLAIFKFLREKFVIVPQTQKINLSLLIFTNYVLKYFYGKIKLVGCNFLHQIFKLPIFVPLCDLDFVGIWAKYLPLQKSFCGHFVTEIGLFGHFDSSNFRPDKIARIY